jgi:hypothetical protein
MALVKQLLFSFSGALLLLCIWGVIVIMTSQDFVHEGPNSIWFSPIDAWSRVFVYIGWAKSVALFSPILGILLGITMLLGPFVLALSVVVHLATILMRKIINERELK